MFYCMRRQCVTAAAEAATARNRETAAACVLLTLQSSRSNQYIPTHKYQLLHILIAKVMRPQTCAYHTSTKLDNHRTTTTTTTKQFFRDPDRRRACRNQAYSGCCALINEQGVLAYLAGLQAAARPAGRQTIAQNGVGTIYILNIYILYIYIQEETVTEVQVNDIVCPTLPPKWECNLLKADPKTNARC